MARRLPPRTQIAFATGASQWITKISPHIPVRETICKIGVNPCCVYAVDPHVAPLPSHFCARVVSKESKETADTRSLQPGDAFLTTQQAAQILQRPIKTLEFWRTLRSGPLFYKQGRVVRFMRSDVLAWGMKHCVETRDRAGSWPDTSAFMGNHCSLNRICQE
jgi:hypothetical protein